MFDGKRGAAHGKTAATSAPAAQLPQPALAFEDEPGDAVMSGREAPIATGNCLPLRNIPLGSVVHCVEMKPGKGGQVARSAGGYAQLAAREGVYATLRLRSGEMRKVLADCRATLGEVSNSEHSLRKLGKAGAARWRGVRPTVAPHPAAWHGRAWRLTGEGTRGRPAVCVLLALPGAHA